MNPDFLPKCGLISNSKEGGFFNDFSPLKGKQLLLIGFSEEEIDLYVTAYEPEKITVLTNWVDHEDAKVSKYPLTIGDITARTSFEDGAFDAILTLSVLEHLRDLRGAFAEMKRLIRIGGELLHMFGPAWSCPYGHHLCANAADPNLNFTSWSLPAHMHLLCTPQEVNNFYLDLGYPREIGLTVLHWFYETPLINRFFYDDYMSVMTQDVGLRLDMMELMRNDLPLEHLARLRSSFPGRWDFSTYGGRYRQIRVA